MATYLKTQPLVGSQYRVKHFLKKIFVWSLVQYDMEVIKYS